MKEKNEEIKYFKNALATIKFYLSIYYFSSYKISFT